MKIVAFLANVLDRLHLTRESERPTPLPTRLISDRELALAISELKRTPTTELAKQKRASAIAELRRLHHSLDEDEPER